METGVRRIHLLGIPIDVISEDNLWKAIETCYLLKDHRQIVLLDFHEMMRSLRHEQRKKALTQAALVIPVSRIIVNAAKFLKKDIPPLHHTYPFIIRLLGILEKKNKSVYLLGSTMKGIRSAESALKSTFPGLHIVGRYAARFPKDRENDVITAIKKSSPTLLLAGKGIKGQHLWISRNREQLAAGLGIWEKNCFDVFSGRKNKPSEVLAVRFLTDFLKTIIKPWRIFRLFRYFYFFLLLVTEKFRKNKNNPNI